jgi:hypothetical protein
MFRYGGAVFRQIARHPIPIDPVNAFLQRQRGILQAFDFRDRHDWSPSRVRITRLRRNDEPEGAKSTGPNLAETMPEVHAIGSPPAGNGATGDRKSNRIAFVQRDHFWPRLHTRTLLCDCEFTAGEIFVGLRQESGNLKGKDQVSIDVLVKVAELGRAVF